MSDVRLTPARYARFRCPGCGSKVVPCFCGERERLAFEADVAAEAEERRLYQEQQQKPVRRARDEYADMGRKYEDRPHLLQWDEDDQR